MVLGQVRPLLEVDERVAVWAHVHAPGGNQQGLLSLTEERCLVHWSPRDEATATFRWAELTAWDVTAVTRGGAVLTMAAGTSYVEVLLPLTTGARARNATSVVEHVVRHAPPEIAVGEAKGPIGLTAERRGWRDHARRVVVTIVGVLVVLLSVVFASPFVPGPGALTLLAGLAILAREYDWARDVHHWVKRKVDRVWTWLQTRRKRSRERTRERGGPRWRPGRRRGAEVYRLPQAGTVAERDARGVAAGPDPKTALRVQNE
jgi:uncharacterized protein (TIGR02611 family)